MPRAFALESPGTFAEFRLVRLLLRHWVLTMKEGELSSAERTDKRRGVAYRTVERLESYLADGTVNLPNSVRHEMLVELLAEARMDLGKPKSKMPKHPALLGLAYGLARGGWRPDGPLLVEVARAAETALPDRTAREYAEAAMQTHAP